MRKNLFITVVLLFLFTIVHSQTATFEGLGYLNEPVFPFGLPSSEANGVSYDGSVVTGVTTSLNEDSNVMEAFRWTADGGMVGLGGLLEGGLFFSYARALSDDGTTVVGYSNSASPEVGGEPFRWTEAEGISGLGDLVPENYSGEACDVSADGSVIVGKSYTTSECFRWEDGEMQRIAEEGTFGEAWGVSADGSVIAGSAVIDGFQQAFRWTEETGMVGLGFPNPYGMGGYSAALKVSGDGTTIVGFQQYGIPDIPYSVFEAFRWTEDTGRVSLGQLSDMSYSEAFDVSDDGSVVVGIAHAGSGIGWRAFIWTEEYGMQNLQELLETEYGLDLTGWSLDKANAISGNGTTIVGTGINPDGNAEAWRVVLSGNMSSDDFSQTEVTVYPNPTTGIINLQTKEKINSVLVYNLAGQRVPFNSLNQENTSIDISNLSSGIYFVEVTLNNNKTVKRYKVIKR